MYLLFYFSSVLVNSVYFKNHQTFFFYYHYTILNHDLRERERDDVGGLEQIQRNRESRSRLLDLSLRLSHRLGHNEARSQPLSCLINDGGSGFGDFGLDRRCVVETNPISSADPSESTYTTKAAALFFTGKCNLNA